MLPENRAMLSLARRFGFTVDTHPDDPRLLRVLLDLEPADASLPAAPARAPRVAALQPPRRAACSSAAA